MSRIVVRMDQAGDTAVLLSRLRATLGLPFSEIKGKFQPGEVLLDCVLFEANHDEVAVQLRELLGDLEQTRSVATVFELPHDQFFETCSNPERYIIALAVLRNILDEHDTRRVR